MGVEQSLSDLVRKVTEYLSAATDIQVAIIVKFSKRRRANGNWGGIALRWSRGAGVVCPQQAISFGSDPLGAAFTKSLQSLTSLGMNITNDGAGRLACTAANAAHFQLSIDSQLVRLCHCACRSLAF